MAQLASISSERSRKLQPVVLSLTGSQLNRDLPRDTYIKFLLCRLSGSVVTTFASGTPVADEFGTFDNLISLIQVKVGGNIIKAVKPYMMHFQQMLATAIKGESAASAGATIATANYPTADVTKMPYGTTGQYTTVRETVVIAFENTQARSGKEKTWLRTAGASSAEVIFSTNAFNSALLGYANTAPLVCSSSTFQVDLYIVEQPDVPDNQELWIWRQTGNQVTFTGAGTTQIKMPKGQFLQDVMLLARDGAAGSTTTATGKVRNSLLITDWALKVSGGEQRTVKSGDFVSMQAELRARFGLSVPMGSNISPIDGLGLIDLLSDDGRGDLNTALDLTPNRADDCILEVTSASASVITYTATATLDWLASEIIKGRAA